MNLQVLISAMNQSEEILLETMNISSDAIVINQCSKNEFKELKRNERNIKIISLNEKGVGKSRNHALMQATSEICLFSDEDAVYKDNYEEIILKAFKDNKKADIILFNMPSTNPDRPTYTIDKHKRVRWYNCQRYGAVKIAFKTQKIRQANVWFSLLFGGGAKYSAGEDSLFISECIRKGLKVYSDPSIIGYVKQEGSSWFKGYNDKYFIDKGAFYYCLSKKWSKVYGLQFLVRHREILENNKTFKEAFMLICKGIRTVRDEQ